MKSFSKKFLFIHIPKTGGNAVQKVLMPYTDDQIYRKSYRGKMLNDFEVKNALGLCRKHEWVGTYINNPHVIEGSLKDYFKFTVVRNPWERMVSWYCWRYPTISKNLDSTHFKEKCLDREHPSMLEYISYDKKIRVDHIIRYENLEEEFGEICERLDIPFVGLERTNTSSHPHYSKFYPDDLSDFLREKYKEDIKEFGYEFEEQ